MLSILCYIQYVYVICMCMKRNRYICLYWRICLYMYVCARAWCGNLVCVMQCTVMSLSCHAMQCNVMWCEVIYVVCRHFPVMSIPFIQGFLNDCFVLPPWHWWHWSLWFYAWPCSASVFNSCHLMLGCCLFVCRVNLSHFSLLSCFCRFFILYHVRSCPTPVFFHLFPFFAF